MEVMKDFYLKIRERESDPELVEHGGIGHKECPGANSSI
jgi:hypothetical protein